MSIVRLEEVTDADRFGGKAFHLGAALRAGLPVPPGHAVSVEALSAIRRGEPRWIAVAGQRAAELGFPVAARSSAVGEDALDASFAGQHLTALNLMSQEATIDALGRVYDSAHTDAARAYRERRGITAEIQVAAVIQKLVDSDCAGVLFTRHPVTGAQERVVEAAWGLGETVVAGLVTPDHYRLSPKGLVLEVRLGEKDLAVRRGPSGTFEDEVAPERVHARCLDDASLTRLHDLASRCEACFGPDLDLEWAFAAGELYLLQSRPISTGPR